MLRKLWPWGRSTRTRTKPEETVAVAAERRRRRVRRGLLALGPALVAIVGGYLFVTGGRYVETDDAFVKADMVALSAQVSGPIVEVSVRDNQHVDQGEILFRIDPEPFSIALAQAEARLHKAENDVRALNASYRQKQEELALARNDVDYAEREFQRQAELARRDFASRAKYDEARHARDAARQAGGCPGAGAARPAGRSGRRSGDPGRSSSDLSRGRGRA